MADHTLIFDADAKDTLVYDPDNGRSCHGGEEFHVNDQLYEELVTNPHIPLLERESGLEKLSRPELNKLAEEHGVEDPESFKTKADVIEAIVNPPTPQPTVGATTFVSDEDLPESEQDDESEDDE